MITKRLVKRYILWGIVIFIFFNVLTMFAPHYDHAEIKQRIGGTLLCKSTNIADHHSWLYDVYYQYKMPDGKIIDMGNGIYFEREWMKDEQLLRQGNKLILKTGGNFRSDELIIKDMVSGKLSSYLIAPDTIEQDSLWKASKIASLNGYCCAEAYIDSLWGTGCIAHCKFRTAPADSNRYDRCQLLYRFDSVTLKPLLVRIWQ